MNLRTWQQECVETALTHYQTQKHFLCLATPGAGKTTMAAEVASRLLEQNAIDFVLCFAPSLAVVSGIKNTFSYRLKDRFDGRIGSCGGTYTYQGMPPLGDPFWSVLDSHRVLIVFDEIHHCSGCDEIGGHNSWGKKILSQIKHKAAYILSLTGTPWRSDKNPIVLSEYSDPDGRIHCDYVYGLQEAVRDQVCRKPRITLVDNENVRLTHGTKRQEFNKLSDLLQNTEVSYQYWLHNDAAIRFCLALACNQLDDIRINTPNAGGLVVASSVAHANQIARLLKLHFNKSASVVTYRHNDPKGVIDHFRNGNSEWIISVGMISEGTDIPRLQVCCHLSRVTTELYFRQVLGRILRTTRSSPDEAWLYTFAEPLLLEYSNRVAEEIPGDICLRYEELQNDKAPEMIPKTWEGPQKWGPSKDYLFEIHDHNTRMSISIEPEHTYDGAETSFNLECLGKFRQQLIQVFQSDLTR